MSATGLWPYSREGNDLSALIHRQRVSGGVLLADQDADPAYSLHKLLSAVPGTVERPGQLNSLPGEHY